MPNREAIIRLLGYEAITGQKADEFLKWFDAIAISALSRNKRVHLFHELIDNVRISPNQIEIEIKANCFRDYLL